MLNKCNHYTLLWLAVYCYRCSINIYFKATSKQSRVCGFLILVLKASVYKQRSISGYGSLLVFAILGGVVS